MQQGSAALETVVTMAILMVLLTLLVQFVVWGYARGVVVAAAQEAARSAAVLGAAEGTCERRFESVRSGLLPGRLGNEVGAVSCTIDEDRSTVSVEVHLRRWVPVSPDWRFTVRSTVVRERAPEAAR